MTNQQKERKKLVVTPDVVADPVVARQLWLLDDTRKRTLEALDGITDRIVNWSPPDGGDSIGTLLYHIVTVELDWLYEEILVQPDFGPEANALLPYEMRDEHGYLTATNHESLQDHLTRLAAGRQLLVAVLQPMSLDDFYRVRTLEPYDVAPEWVLHHLMQHEAEHRGAMLELRRRAELALSIAR